MSPLHYFPRKGHESLRPALIWLIHQEGSQTVRAYSASLPYSKLQHPMRFIHFITSIWLIFSLRDCFLIDLRSTPVDLGNYAIAAATGLGEIPLTDKWLVFAAFLWILQGDFEEMETLVLLFSFSALGILYAMNTIPELQEWVICWFFKSLSFFLSVSIFACCATGEWIICFNRCFKLLNLANLQQIDLIIFHIMYMYIYITHHIITIISSIMSFRYSHLIKRI